MELRRVRTWCCQLETRLSCPYCGTPVKGNENFCRYCGRLIKGKSSAPGFEEETSAQSAIPEDVLEQIDIRVQLGSIESRQKAFKEEVAEMDSLLKNADIPPSEYKERITKIRDENTSLKDQRTQLEDKKKAFPFEQHKTQLDELREKIGKLEKLRSAKQITDEAYKSLSREYQLKKRDLENMIITDTNNLKEWVNLLGIERNSVKRRLDILSAKQAVGELPDKDYTEEKKKLEDRLMVTEFGVDFLKKFLLPTK